MYPVTRWSDRVASARAASSPLGALQATTRRRLQACMEDLWGGFTGPG